MTIMLSNQRSVTEKIIRKDPNTWKSNNTLLIHPSIKEEVSKEIKKYIYIELNESENTTCQNLWDTAKAILRRISIA